MSLINIFSIQIHLRSEWIAPEADVIYNNFKKLSAIMNFVAHSVFLEHGNKPKLAESMEDYGKNVWKRIQEIHRPNGKFICMLHNDAWTNNFLFR